MAMLKKRRQQQQSARKEMHAPPKHGPKKQITKTLFDFECMSDE